MRNRDHLDFFADSAVDDAVGEGGHHEPSGAEMKERPALGCLLQQREPGIDIGQKPLARDGAAAKVEAQAFLEIALRLGVSPDARSPDTSRDTNPRSDGTVRRRVAPADQRAVVLRERRDGRGARRRLDRRVSGRVTSRTRSAADTSGTRSVHRCRRVTSEHAAIAG